MGSGGGGEGGSLKMKMNDDEHLDQSLGLGFFLGQAMRDERPQHIPLPLRVWLEALVHHLFG